MEIGLGNRVRIDVLTERNRKIELVHASPVFAESQMMCGGERGDFQKIGYIHIEATLYKSNCKITKNRPNSQIYPQLV